MGFLGVLIHSRNSFAIRSEFLRILGIVLFLELQNMQEIQSFLLPQVKIPKPKLLEFQLNQGLLQLHHCSQ